MHVLDPQTLVERVCRVDIDVADRSTLLAGLESLRRVRARADLAEIAIAHGLESFTATTEKDVSAAANRSTQHGERLRCRSRAIEKVPALVKELANGALSGEHADSVAKALRAAPAELRKALAESANTLVELAAVSGLTPQELSYRLSKEATRLAGDGGASKLERQRRATRLRTWVDRGDGTFRLYGVFDPLTGVVLHGRLQVAMAAMFAEGFLAMAPDDPSERQDFLRALALIALTAGQATTKRHSPCNNTPDSRNRNRARAGVSGINDLIHADNDNDRAADNSPVAHGHNEPASGTAHANTTAGTVAAAHTTAGASSVATEANATANVDHGAAFSSNDHSSFNVKVDADPNDAVTGDAVTTSTNDTASECDIGTDLTTGSPAMISKVMIRDTAILSVRNVAVRIILPAAAAVVVVTMLRILMMLTTSVMFVGLRFLLVVRHVSVETKLSSLSISDTWIVLDTRRLIGGYQSICHGQPSPISVKPHQFRRS